MRAVWLRSFGGPEVLEAGDAPEPEVGPGCALIDVALANITFVETQLRAGTGPYRPELPMIPGNGVGGQVIAVGMGVDPSLIGTTVITSTGGSGGYAERVAVEAAGVIAVPPNVSLDDAVALLADGRTAMLLMQAAAVQPGDRVLVEAAAGGVGTLLVQLATNAAGTVVAAAGGQRKLDVAAGLGAVLTVDYGESDWADRVRDAIDGVDVVFDGIGGSIAAAAFGLLHEGGRMVTFGMASGAFASIDVQMAEDRGITLLSPRPAPDEMRQLVERALAEAAAGRLRPVIGQRFALDHAAAAHAAIEARSTIGKTLLTVR